MPEAVIMTREQFVQAYYDKQLFWLTAHDNALREKIDHLYQELEQAAKERGVTYAIGNEV